MCFFKKSSIDKELRERKKELKAEAKKQKKENAFKKAGFSKSSCKITKDMPKELKELIDDVKPRLKFKEPKCIRKTPDDNTYVMRDAKRSFFHSFDVNYNDDSNDASTCVQRVSVFRDGSISTSGFRVEDIDPKILRENIIQKIASDNVKNPFSGKTIAAVFSILSRRNSEYRERYSVRYSMQNLPNEMREEANTILDSIYGQAVTILVFVLLFYVVLLKGHVIGKESILRKETFAWFFNNAVLEDIWDYFLENLIIAGIFTVILGIVRFFKKKKWIIENRSLWLEGKWLHIHEKNNNTVRVGFADILQNYDSISVDCRNYDVEDILNEDKITNWHYINAQINKDGDKSFMLQGFYSATKSGSGERNSGMHTLSIINNGGDPPTEMAGYFGDVNTIVKDTAASSKDNYLSCGRIRMYRMTKEQEENLFDNGVFLPERLKQMLEENVVWLKDRSSKRYVEAVKNAVKKVRDKAQREGK